jgi:hypothetical protein
MKEARVCETCVFSTLRNDTMWCLHSFYLPTLPESTCPKWYERQARPAVTEEMQKPLQK